MMQQNGGAWEVCANQNKLYIFKINYNALVGVQG